MKEHPEMLLLCQAHIGHQPFSAQAQSRHPQARATRRPAGALARGYTLFQIGCQVAGEAQPGGRPSLCAPASESEGKFVSVYLNKR